MNLKAVIVDDEIAAIETLKLLLGNVNEIELVGTAQTVAEAINLINTVQPNLAFLDIELTDGSGFEIAEKTKEIAYKLIFVTAYNHYAIKAFKANAIDYMLKPIDLEDFESVISKILAQSEINQLGSSKFSIIEKNEFNIYDEADIVRFQGDSNYTKVFFENGNHKTMSKTLKNIEKKLNNSLFIRVHHSHIVNINFIHKYIKGDGGEIHLKNGDIVPVSRAKKELVLKMLKV